MVACSKAWLRRVWTTSGDSRILFMLLFYHSRRSTPDWRSCEQLILAAGGQGEAKEHDYRAGQLTEVKDVHYARLEQRASQGG